MTCSAPTARIARAHSAAFMRYNRLQDLGFPGWEEAMAIYGVLRTAQAATPALNEHSVATSLAVSVVIYSFIFTFGSVYIHRLLRVGPPAQLAAPNRNATARRPMSVLDEHVARQDLEALVPASPATSAVFEK